MGGPAEPPEGGPEGGAGGEDEFRSVVFDESFIRAARIQEPSASERLSGEQRSVRRRSGHSGLPRQALALMLLIGFAFATAVYMGVRHPYAPPITGAAANLTTQVIPLEPGPAGIPTDRNPVPLGPNATATPGAVSGARSGASSGASVSGAGAASPSVQATSTALTGLDPVYGGLPGAEFLPIGATGFNLPNPRHTDHFSHDQVGAALEVVRGYLAASSLNPDVVSGRDTDTVRNYVSPGQEAQFNDSINHPQNDQRHLATGWMVRFDPAKVRLATTQVLVAPGRIAYHELDSGTLEVTSDYTFVYALTAQSPTSQTPASASASASPSASGTGAATPAATAAAPQPIVYYAVRRALTFWLTPDDIVGHSLQVVDSVVQAGATSCNADNSEYLQPLFPTTGHHSAKSGPIPRPSASPTPGAVDPFDHTRNAWTVCGRLSWVM